jgi:predicted  nucleic acid-binding Zn-ribbon protein
MKKLFAIMLPIVLVFGTLYAYISITGQDTLGYVSVDINPSVQFITNANNEVIGVTASNDDGEIILMGEIDNLLGMNIELATQRIVELAIEYGYLDPEALETDPSAVIVTDLDLTDVITEAETLGISVAKYKLIKSVQTLYPELLVEEALELEIKELMNMLKEVGGLEDAQERIEKRIDLVAHFQEKVEQMQTEITELQSTLATKENDLAILELVDTTSYDQVQLDAYNLELANLTTEITNIGLEIIALEEELAGLQNALTQHIGRYDELFVNRLQQQRETRRQEMEEKYNTWMEEKEQRASEIAARWENFKNNIPQGNFQDILDNIQNRFGFNQ